MAQVAPRPNSGQTVFSPWTDPTQKPLISVRNVTKRFGEFVAIDNLNIDIFEREFYALLGPSGCGKTTLMRMLAGFETPSSGTITIGGQDMADVPPNKRPVNMMFQSYALFPHLSVENNIAFGLHRDGMPKDQIAVRVKEMLDLVQLGKFAKRMPHQISGGQRQRVALARSLAKAPKLLLLDEPLGALDKKLRQDTQFELMDIQERTKTTFVIVTHDQEEAMTVASRVAVMNEGKLIQVDTPSRIYEAPVSTYVADFIGDINIINGTLSAREANGEEGFRYRLDWAEGNPPLSASSLESFDMGERRAFAIRPEKIAITSEKPTDKSNVLEGQVLDIAYLGNLSTYVVELDNGKILKAQTANTRRLARRNITWYDRVYLSFTDTAGVLLPADGE